MSYLPEDKKNNGDKKVSQGRIMIWIVVGGVGVYFLGQGIFGIVTGSPG
jgi:hypothetical protein